MSRLEQRQLREQETMKYKLIGLIAAMIFPLIFGVLGFTFIAPLMGF